MTPASTLRKQKDKSKQNPKQTNENKQNKNANQ